MCYGSGCPHELSSGDCGLPRDARLQSCPGFDDDPEFEVEVYMHGTAYVTAKSAADAEEIVTNRILADRFTGKLGFLTIEMTAEEA